MELETKVLSRDLHMLLYDSHCTVGTAESCTGGRIAETIIATPGASNYFKGGVICYSDEVKENLLHVDPELIREKSAVCEEVAIAMVKGACEQLSVDYAIAITGFAGPNALNGIPVGTIWIACGTKEEQVTEVLTEDLGRDRNLSVATHRALRIFLAFLKERLQQRVEDENQ